MFQTAPIGFNPIGVPLQAPRFQPPVQVPQTPPALDHKPEIATKNINYLADYSGCGYWRMIWPEHVLNAHQKAVVHGTTMMVLDERYYENTLSVRVQRQATEHQLKFIRFLREIANKKNIKIIYEIDDCIQRRYS